MTMKNLSELINEFKNKVINQEIINLSISQGSVGWHIEHSLLTINKIVEALKKSNPENYKRAFNFARLLVFTINKIPRGRAQSPASVTPADFNESTLQHHILLTNKNLKELESLQADNYFEHPFFGKLNLSAAKKFIAIHINHHCKIINDIIKANQNKKLNK